MELILQSNNIYYVSHDTVLEFENSILTDSQIKNATAAKNINLKIWFLILRRWEKVGYKINHLLSLFVKATVSSKKKYFAILMGPDFSKCFPWFFIPAVRNIYVFDAWPENHDSISKFIDKYAIQNVFLSSSKAVEKLKAMGSKAKYHWIPEGINPEKYTYVPYDKKEIDVLALGRKYEWYHEIIKNPLLDNGYSYLYEKAKGELIFPTRIEFIDGIARAKISICVPSNITHPERSGDIETMTIRYLQSMVSKCLIVGHAPKEMIDLFGYNPVIEINMEDPVSQIIHLLENYFNYIPLIEKNYSLTVNHHTWINRWNEIKKVISQGQSCLR